MERYVNAKWFKSTRSGTGDCVEVAFVPDGVAVRDSKDRTGPVLLFTQSEWAALVAGMKDGEFDQP